jgi:ribosomal protein S12 methylthiotransferase accessory factor
MSNKIILNDAYKKFTNDQDKICSPEETVNRFKDKIKKLDINILEEVRRIDNGRLDIPVYFSICSDEASAVTGTKKQMGKGATPIQSEASAVMELAERFSFFSFKNTPENFITDTYKNVKEKAVPFELIANSVHDSSLDMQILEELFSDLPLKWTWGFNLTKNEEVLVPFDWFFAINEFNGPSAGNCDEEAICQGISEIVERDVCSRISHEELKVPSVTTEDVTDPQVLDMLEKYKNAGIKLYISDFSLDTNICTVGVLAYDPSTFPESSELVWTAGTAPDPQKALSRALTEVAQLAGDFNSNSNYLASGLPKFTNLDDASYIIDSEKSVKMADLPDQSDNNIKTEIENYLKALSDRGQDVILINTRHPKLDIAAFYTIIPGSHFRERSRNTSVGMFASKLITEKYNPAEAIQKLYAIEKLLSGKYYVNFYLGYCYLEIGNPENALKYLTKSLDQNPLPQDIPSIYSYMGICLKELEEYKGALDILEQGIELDNERYDIFNLMGFCHFKLKEHEKAIDCFRNSLELNPGSGIDYANIASNYRDMGEKDKAISYYRIALEFDPSLDFARDNLETLQAG